MSLALTPSVRQPTYGFMNWILNTGRKRIPAAPATAFHHERNGLNTIYCGPEHDLVVVVCWIDRQVFAGVIERVLAAAGN